MDDQTQKHPFVQAVEEYRKRTGKTIAEVADALGVLPTEMEASLATGKIKLRHSVLLKASTLFGVSAAKLVPTKTVNNTTRRYIPGIGIDFKDTWPQRATFSDALDEYSENKDIPLWAVADALEIPYSDLLAYRNGHRDPPLEVLQDAANLVGLPLAIFTGSDYAPNFDVWPQRAAFKQALDDYRTSTGKKNPEIARELGMSLDGFKQFLYRPDRKPSIATMQKASILFGVSVTTFLSDPGGTPYDNSNTYPVPKYKLHLCAGMGNEVSSVAEETETHKVTYPVSNDRIKRLGVNAKNLYFFDVDGDSMEPRLLDGDRVLVDMAAVNQGFKSGGVWMLRVGNVVMVKRVQLVGAEQYQASSDNPAYPPFLLNDTCELLGRVVSLERDI